MTDFPVSASDFERLQRENLYAFLLVYLKYLMPGRAFRRAAHVEAMCFALEKARRGEIKRLIITVPPRHLKSKTVAVAFVAWLLGHDPSKQVMVVSYGAELAEAHARDFRSIIRAPDFLKLFPRFRVRPDRDTVDETVTTLGGGRLAISVGGRATGLGADIVICDDLLKAADARSDAVRTKANEFFDETLYSRLNLKSEGVIIVIQQRLHEDDLVGHLIEQGGWHHINMPAIADCDIGYPLYQGRTFDRKKGDLLAPALENHADLEEAKRRMGPIAFNAQYLLDPQPPEGNRIDWKWFDRYVEPLPRADYAYIVQSWDTATSDDPNAAYSVCMTYGYDQGKWDLLDIFRQKLTYPNLRKAAKRLYQEWKPDRVLIEDASTGRVLIQEMLEDLPEARRGDIVKITPLTNKEERLDLQTGKLERKLIVLPETAPWLEAFRNELRRFPLGKYMDQVDALSQFLEWTSTRQGRNIDTRDPVTGRPRKRPRPRGMNYGMLGR